MSSDPLFLSDMPDPDDERPRRPRPVPPARDRETGDARGFEIDEPAPRRGGWIRRRLPQRSRGWWAVRAFAGVLLLFMLLVGWLAVTAPLSKSLKPISPPQITLLAADGTPIARNGAIVEAPVEIAKLPKYVPGAFVAIEDRRFYEHGALDFRGIARALWSNLTSSRVEGASTITQQLAKFTFLTPDRNLTRKAREALIAFWLEAWLTKDQILERYLSNAYFGDNTYGLRAASLHYFDRQPETLTRAQAAMLAGLMQAPSRYAPTHNYKLASARMKQVVAAMADTGLITAAEARTMRPPRLDPRSSPDIPTGTYFADWALPQARRLGEGGYAQETYTTTLDARLQAAARQAIAGARLGKAQVALVAMKPDGEVVAMVGGKDYAASPFNRVTQARRQPGSTFKLFVYLAALRDGWKPSDTIDNTEITTGGYRPRNAGGHYSPTITLREAFARSSNVAAVRLFQKVGDRDVIAMARALGVTAPLPEGDPSLPLGTSTMTLMELTAAYAGVAGNRFPVVPTAFAPAQEGWFGRMLSGKKTLSTNDRDEMELLLRSAINEGTGRAAMLRVPNYGKTGTTQDNRDALFVGYAGGLVVGVWIGNDDNSPLGDVHGGSLPAQIWRDFMRSALHEATPAPAPAAPDSPDPEGPVQPLDLPRLGAIPIDEANSIDFDKEGATWRTRIDGKPLDLRIDSKGLRIDGGDGRGRTLTLPSGAPPPVPAPSPAPRPQAAPPPGGE